MASDDAALANAVGCLGNWELTLLTASCPSTIPVSGLENQSLNCAWLAKTCAPKAPAVGDCGFLRANCHRQSYELFIVRTKSLYTLHPHAHMTNGSRAETDCITLHNWRMSNCMESLST